MKPRELAHLGIPWSEALRLAVGIRWIVRSLLILAGIGSAGCTGLYATRDYVVPPNLTLSVASDGQYRIDGRPALESPPIATAPLRVGGGFAISEIKLQARWRSREWRQEVVADTGGMMFLTLSRSTFDRACSWTWTDSVDRARFWNIAEGVNSLGVIETMSIGGARLNHVAAGIERDGPWTLPMAGIQLLALFDAAVFAWSQGELLLLRDVASIDSAIGEIHPARSVSRSRWWTPLFGAAAGRQSGYVVIGASLDDVSFEAMLDTGANSDLVLPRSTALAEPWASRLRSVGPIRLHGPAGSAMADRYALTSLLTVGGTAWDEIAVLVVDDSTLPAGASLLPIIGTPLLSRFERVTFNFANKVVIFDSKADAKSSR